MARSVMPSVQLVLLLVAVCAYVRPGAGQDAYGTVTFSGQGTSDSAAVVSKLSSSYRFVTTAVRNNFATGTDDLSILARVANGSSNYGVIDDLQAADLPASVLAVPLFGAAIVLPYDLSTFGSFNVSVTADVLTLDLATIGLIFSGSITQWNDSRITALNTNWEYYSQLAASSLSINVVVRSDASPITRAFTRALSNASATFASVVGVSELPSWPSGFVQAAGASGVLAAIQGQVGSIGFVGLPAWTSAASTLPYTAIRNENYATVLPTVTDVQRLMADNAAAFNSNNSMVASLIGGNTSTTWPLGWMTYLVAPTSGFSSCSIPADLFQWYSWIEGNTQAASTLSTAGFASLHYSVLTRATTAVGGVTCNGTRSIPTSLLTGSGSTLAQLPYLSWILEYNTNVNSSVAVEYTGTGSSIGITDILAYNTDFGASDSVLSAANRASPGGADLQMLPAIAAAVVVVYNLPEIGSTPIMFTREIIPKIFLGEITWWNDSLIVEANPELTLPNEKITVVGRSDGSGTTTVFTQALSSFSSVFNQTIGTTSLVAWKTYVPGALVGSGNPAVVSLIKATPHSLGYAVNADAIQAGLPFTTMLNKAGVNVTANPDSINAALSEFANAFTPQFTATVLDGSSAGAWPMTTYSYIILHTSTMKECGKASSVLDFIVWSQTSSTPIALAADLGYTVTPIAVRRQFLLTLAEVTCGGESIFSLIPCLVDGVICSNVGTCLDGGCTCQTGYTGSQCQDVVGAGSSSDTLAIALGVALPVGFLFLCCLIAVFVIFAVMYRRKGQHKELLLAEQWSDHSAESMELDDFSSRSTNSTRSGTGAVSRDLSFTDLEQLHLSYEPKLLTFGLGASDKCPVDEEMHDQFVLTNYGSSSRKFVLYVPAEDETLKCQLHPGAGVVKAGKSVTISVSCTLLMTTTIERKIKFEVEGLGRHLIGIKLIGELSTKLDPNDIVTVPPPIGIGSFGSVYKADYRGQEVAAKILNSQMNAKQIDEFKREVNILNRLRCPYVLNFIGASHVEGKRCIITELCSQGSLADLVFSDKSFNYLLLLKVALDMSKAVAFLHGNGVLHRDVKPENFLVVSTSTKSPVTCKIADFGTSRSITSVRELLNHTAALGTPLYMAPEVLEHQPYSAKIDVYSFGVVLWVLYTRREPYTELKRQWDVPRYVIKGKRPAIPHHCPKGFGDLISQCWAHSPDDRPDMPDVVKVLERLFENERSVFKRGRPGDVDEARDLDTAPDAVGNRERVGMRTWEGGKNLLMADNGDEDESDSEEKEGKRKSKRVDKN